MSEMTKMRMAQCSVKALDRSEWRTMVSNLYAETELRLIEHVCAMFKKHIDTKVYEIMAQTPFYSGVILKMYKYMFGNT